MNKTPFFSPQFHIQTLSKKRRSPTQRLADELRETRSKRIDQLSKAFSKLIPDSLLKNNESQEHSRSRIYTKKTTFWAFFSQVISPDGGCAEVVSKLRAFSRMKFSKPMSPSTGAYCQARGKLVYEELKAVFDHTVSVIDSQEQKILCGRRVVVVDGTGLTAADTEENQEEWPQYKSQEPGCGFPAMRLCALFSLKTGAALGYRIGHRKKHELRLFREMWDLLKPEDICLGDKGFSTFFDMAELAGKGVDSVTTQRTGRRRPVSEKECIKKLGENDLLVEWKRPVWQKKAAYTAEQYEALPETLTLRQIKVEVTQKGFRTKEFHIITTLLDPVDYPAGELAELYLRRWEIELNLDDLKTTMGMDMLRCKTPAMVKKELLMYFIAYNATRWMINNAAIKHQADPMRISFKGALQELRNWDFLLNDPDLTQSDKRKIMDELYRGISQRIVPFRPNRREPRCLKRRPKSYQLLTEHRHTMREIEHRSNYRAKAS
jgi:hypothetical protein